MIVDTVIKGSKIATSRGVFEAGVAIEGGVIVALAKDSSLPEAQRTIDAREKSSSQV